MSNRIITASRRLISRLPIDGKMLAAFVVLIVLLLAFAKIASEVFEGETMAFDHFLITALRSPADPALPVGPGWLRLFMIDITAFGGITGLVVIASIATGYLLVRCEWAQAIFLACATGGGWLVSDLLKSFFNRPRPDLVDHLVEVHSLSFPSGHAMNSAVVFLTLGALIARNHTERAPRIYILTVAILLTLVIGFSRIYLGVHWPTDVMAGWIVGGLWAVLCWSIARRLQPRRSPNQP